MSVRTPQLLSGSSLRRTRCRRETAGWLMLRSYKPILVSRTGPHRATSRPSNSIRPGPWAEPRRALESARRCDDMAAEGGRSVHAPTSTPLRLARRGARWILVAAARGRPMRQGARLRWATAVGVGRDPCRRLRPAPLLESLLLAVRTAAATAAPPSRRRLKNSHVQLAFKARFAVSRAP